MSVNQSILQPSQTTDTWSPVVELRQYTLLPRARDVLISLFDREFVESQEDAGIRVIGQFRDIDDPDRFVWLRGFPDMPARGIGLESFYGGAVWQQYRDAANATLIDSDNVLLLRPARPNSGFAPVPVKRPPRGTTGNRSGVVIASVFSLRASDETNFVDYFERELKPQLEAVGGSVLAYFVTERSPNNFRLPVREGENVFVWFAGFAGQRSDESVMMDLASLGKLADSPGQLQSPIVMRLAPTVRSLVTGSSPACASQAPVSSQT